VSLGKLTAAQARIVRVLLAHHHYLAAARFVAGALHKSAGGIAVAVAQPVSHSTSFIHNPNFLDVLYIVAFGLFIYGLSGLTGPRAAATGSPPSAWRSRSSRRCCTRARAIGF